MSFNSLLIRIGAFLLLPSAFAVSCKSDIVEQFKADDATLMTLEAGMPGTRTVSEGNVTMWAAGDRLSVIHIKSGGTKFFVSPFTYSGQGSAFSGEVSSVASENDWYVIYPYDANLASPEAVSFTVPSVQTQTDTSSTAHLAGETFPLWGKLTGVAKDDALSLSMHHTTARMRLRVENKTEDQVPVAVSSIEISSPVAMVGKLTADLTAESPAWTPEVAGPSTFTLNVSYSEGLQPIAPGGDAYFWVGIAPCTIPAGEILSVKVNAVTVPAEGEGEEVVFNHEYSWDSDVTFEAGKVTKIAVGFEPEEEEPVTPEKYTLLKGVPADWSATSYLIVSGSKVFAPLSDKSSDYAADVTFNEDGSITATDEINKYALTVGDTGDEHKKFSGSNCLNVFNSEGSYVVFGKGSGGSGSGTLYLQSSNKINNNSYYHGIVASDTEGVFTVGCARSASSGSSYYLTYSSDAFTYTSTASTVSIYALATKLAQNLSFAASSISWNLGTDCNVGETKALPQTVQGAVGKVTYTSTNEDVATVSGTTLTIKGAGRTTIVATAAATGDYAAGTASFGLVIVEDGNFSIENESVAQYLDYVYANPYSTTDYTYTYVTNYSAGNGENNRLDWPAPVTLGWSNEGKTLSSSTTAVTVYNKDGSEELSVSVASSSTSADIYNLIPGLEYTYKVVNGSETVSEGNFKTTGRRRMIKAGSSYGKDYANNCRDLGGQITDEGTVKYGKIFRGSNLDKIANDAEGLSVLVDYLKIGLDVDLRGDTKGDSPLGSGVDVVNVKFSKWSDLSQVDSMKRTLVPIFEAVAADKPVYIHCSVGADRTGYVCLLLESILGVDQSRCDVDYELTSFASSVVDERNRTLNSGSHAYYTADGEGVHYLSTFEGATFKEKAYNCLIQMGITDEQITAFRSAMIDKF